MNIWDSKKWSGDPAMQHGRDTNMLNMLYAALQDTDARLKRLEMSYKAIQPEYEALRRNLKGMRYDENRGGY